MSSSRAVRSSRTKASGEVAALPARSAPPAIPEVVIGRFLGLDETGQPLIDFPGNPPGRPLRALTTAPLAPSAAGRDVALLFADGDLAQPVVIGLIQRPAEDGTTVVDAIGQAPDKPAEARVDGERVVLSADKEIVLKCGKASITLTRAGKVLIRGAYLLNRSSGVNRIKGGSVQIN